MGQENLSYSGKPSWLNQMGSLLAMMILILMPFFSGEIPLILVMLNMIVAVLIFLTIIYIHYTQNYKICDGDVQSRQGIMPVEENSIRLKDISDVRIKQTTIQRAFGVGDLEFNSADGSNDKIVFQGIKAPSVLRDAMLLALNKNEKKKKRGAQR